MNEMEARRSITAYLGVRGIRTGQIQSDRQLKFLITKMFPALKFSEIENLSMVDLHERVEDHCNMLCRAERAAEAKIGRDRIKGLRKGNDFVSNAPKFLREYPTLDNHDMTIGEMRLYDLYIKENSKENSGMKKEDVEKIEEKIETKPIEEKVTEVIPIPEDEQRFTVGEYVAKFGGDYSFEGWVVAAYQKRSGGWRYVIEDSRGMNMIMNGRQIGRQAAPKDI